MKRSIILLAFMCLFNLLKAGENDFFYSFNYADLNANGTVTDIDGNTYKTVKIGNQLWMAENLKVTKYNNGDIIPNVKDNNSWSNLTSGAWCLYNNEAKHENPYGKLYNWYTVNDPRGLCPAGFHIPSDSEWTILSTTVGGETAAGGQLKESGTTHWFSPNKGATNESGFTAIPGGTRDNGNGEYNGLENTAYIWTSKEFDKDNAWSRSFSYYYSGIYSSYRNKHYGFSVRCVSN
jgi:uncharacterized protein (TIGR02145 family)